MIPYFQMKHWCTRRIRQLVISLKNGETVLLPFIFSNVDILWILSFSAVLGVDSLSIFPDEDVPLSSFPAIHQVTLWAHGDLYHVTVDEHRMRYLEPPPLDGNKLIQEIHYDIPRSCASSFNSLGHEDVCVLSSTHVKHQAIWKRK